jgi:hypothetical protein
VADADQPQPEEPAMSLTGMVLVGAWLAIAVVKSRKMERDR